jgi:hypothetical protein
MKKTIVLTLLAGTALFWQSCTKSCTCENPDNSTPTEIEISPSEKCSDYSGIEYGNCS